MSKNHKVSFNGTTFYAQSGQVLLDAALVQGIEMPHDCRAGRCGSCLTRVAEGITVGGETHQSGMVHACQARVLSDLTLTCEPLPPVEIVTAKVTHYADLTDDVAELTLRPDRPLTALPGQYFRFQFQGFPARPFSPTAALDGRAAGGSFCLNIKRVRGGRVTSHLGTRINTGHSVRMIGPFGHCFLRPRETGRLVLVAGGTGFAPIWSIADAALRENPRRTIWITGGVRRAPSLYMLPALELAGRFPNVTSIATVEKPEAWLAHIHAGTPDQHIPPLTSDDTVYAAGGPDMVNRLAAAAKEAGAEFYSDPFDPGPGDDEIFTKIGSWLRAKIGGQIG